MNYYLLRLADTTASVVSARGYEIRDGLLYFDNDSNMVVKSWATVSEIDKETDDQLMEASHQFFRGDLASAEIGGEA